MIWHDDSYVELESDGVPRDDAAEHERANVER
jgi:hypothetical protein